jgi:hypothetical protein
MNYFQAVASGNLKNVRNFIEKKGVNVNSVDPSFGTTALVTASARGHNNVVRYLINKGAKVNPRLRTTPLMEAVLMGKLNVVRMLLDAGANVNTRDKRGVSVLMYALGRRPPKLEIARLLLDRGASINLKDIEGRKTMDYARNNNNARNLLQRETLKRLSRQAESVALTNYSVHMARKLKMNLKNYLRTLGHL